MLLIVPTAHNPTTGRRRNRYHPSINLVFSLPWSDIGHIRRAIAMNTSNPIDGLAKNELTVAYLPHARLAINPLKPLMRLQIPNLSTLSASTAPLGNLHLSASEKTDLDGVRKNPKGIEVTSVTTFSCTPVYYNDLDTWNKSPKLGYFT